VVACARPSSHRVDFIGAATDAPGVRILLQ